MNHVLVWGCMLRVHALVAATTQLFTAIIRYLVLSGASMQYPCFGQVILHHLVLLVATLQHPVSCAVAPAG